MDKCTTEVRRQYWKGIIAQCQERPEGQTAKAWLKKIRFVNKLTIYGSVVSDRKRLRR